jgi:hypothetical protein
MLQYGGQYVLLCECANGLVQKSSYYATFEFLMVVTEDGGSTVLHNDLPYYMASHPGRHMPS